MKFLVIVLFLHSANSFGISRCPKYDSINDFNITKFAGRWYEVERTFYFWELYTKCLRVDISPKKRGQIELSVVRINRLTGNQKLTDGVATKSRKDPSIYQLRVSTSLPKSIDKFLPGSAAYQVLYTDYTNFAVISSCSSYGLFHHDRIWILGRSWDITVDTRAKIYNFLNSRHVDTDRLLISSNGCAL